jgi:hypothetical protein
MGNPADNACSMVAKDAVSVSLTPEDRAGFFKERKKKRRTVLPSSTA